MFNEKFIVIMMNRKLKRTLPYLRLLIVAPPKSRCKMLKSYPSFVVDDMVEILYNILTQNITLRNPKYLSFIKRRKRLMTEIFKVARNPKQRKQIILNQKGGFIGAVLPILASVIGGLVGSIGSGKE